MKRRNFLTLLGLSALPYAVSEPTAEAGFAVGSRHDLAVFENPEYITDICLWDTVLTEEQVKELFAKGAGMDPRAHSAAAGLTGIWVLGTAEDSSFHQMILTHNGDPDDSPQIYADGKLIPNLAGETWDAKMESSGLSKHITLGPMNPEPTEAATLSFCVSNEKQV